jgi:hypothetical protein
MLTRSAFAAVLLIAAVLSVETAVRLTYLLRDQLFERRGFVLDPQRLQPHEMEDRNHPGNWLLRPGATVTLREAIEQKGVSGLENRVPLLVESARRLGIGEQDIIMRVNSRGYKGPEIDARHSNPRILTIGDTCTFGTLIDWYSFPRSLERELERLGFPVEVVNGGVARYFPANAFTRIGEFKALVPEITILYMGWNALWDERRAVRDLTDPSFSLRALRTLGTRWRSRSSDPSELQRERERASKELDPRGRAVEAMARYQPSFMRDVEKIVSEMVSSGSHVFVVTLPGLYRLDEIPISEALAIGHLPGFTNNPFVIAKIADL